MTTANQAPPAGAAALAADDEITAYGDHVLTVEPTGTEPVPAEARHGKPLGLLWTWTSPNMEFATVFIGVLAVGIFGLGFWPALLAIILGTALGTVAHGLLGLAGPRFGVPQMVSGRSGFGFLGNALPAALNALTAGIGWFAVNSVSAAYALNSLLGWPVLLCLFIAVVIQVGIAFLGHNFIHSVEKYTFPVLTVVFVAASIVLLSKSHLGVANGAHAAPGAFLLTAGAAFGYAAGWTPYASDYTRYLPASSKKWQVFLWPALGVFLSCVFLEAVGAASVTIALPKSVEPFSTTAFVQPLPTALRDLTLLAIAVGGIAANALNIYSGALSFVAMGIRLPASVRRATVALVFGVAGTAVAWSGLHDYGTKYNDFLLVITYWIGPWMAIVFTDRILRRGQSDAQIALDIENPRFSYWAAPLAMALGTALSVLLFSNQSDFTGYVARHVSNIGDIAFAVGFFLTAGFYVALRRIPSFGPVAPTAPATEPEPAAA
jgi:nucleobase:cation symporter-1, NCS1 family